ncbi:hypothetical protein [Desulfuromonas acetoxidans]|nr:hypothetical protein [Desulfuromonas acetoxidans]MBF0645345.1 hypothetical protein [Desulfuromonas acetoxidans]NVD23424.1 hypothetical protein [Desulfuromonas acetoxidans]NVE15335.1 hypothetical protein [Desulfuromonas acetoxidans]
MNDKNNDLKNENYLAFFLLILALMAFAVIVKSCNIAQYNHQNHSVELHDL